MSLSETWEEEGTFGSNRSVSSGITKVLPEEGRDFLGKEAREGIQDEAEGRHGQRGVSGPRLRHEKDVHIHQGPRGRGNTLEEKPPSFVGKGEKLEPERGLPSRN